MQELSSDKRHCNLVAQDSTYVSPRSVVWAPPGSRLGPVTSEILAGMGSQGGTVARGSASNSATAGDGERSIMMDRLYRMVTRSNCSARLTVLAFRK